MRSTVLKTAALFVLAVLPFSGAVHADGADGAAVQSVVEQLRCGADPDALPAIAYFAKRRLIDLKDNVGADSVSCFALKKPFDLDGLKIEGICGSTEDALKMALWPDVFYRGPGTSPGISLSVTTKDSKANAAAWAAAHDIPTTAVESSYFLDGQVQVECNSMSRL